MNLAGTDDLNFAPNEPSGTKISPGVSSSFNLAFVAFVRTRSLSAREARVNTPTPGARKRDKTILVKRKSERERNIRVYCVCSAGELWHLLSRKLRVASNNVSRPYAFPLACDSALPMGANQRQFAIVVPSENGDETVMAKSCRRRRNE